MSMTENYGFTAILLSEKFNIGIFFTNSYFSYIAIYF